MTVGLALLPWLLSVFVSGIAVLQFVLVAVVLMCTSNLLLSMIHMSSLLVFGMCRVIPFAIFCLLNMRFIRLADSLGLV